MKPSLFLTLAIFLVSIPIALPAQEQHFQSRNHIFTQGSAEVTGQNDSAKLQLSIQTEAKAMDNAAVQNATRTEAVLQAIKNLKIPGLKMQTNNYRVVPQKDFKARPPVIRGYEVQNEIEVTAEGFPPKNLSDYISTVIDTALKKGANTVRTIQFYIKDKKRLEQQGLTLATQDAIDQAHILANAAGVKLGRIVSISTQPVAVPLRSNVFKVAAMADQEASMKPPIESGENTIYVNVSVVYEIE
jgi:uncharacterized protein YggE